jgi:Fe-S-cluster-containing hydrogenase component 2
VCRVCGAACPADAIRFERDQVLIDETACNRCLVCVSVCPEDTIGKDIFA